MAFEEASLGRNKQEALKRVLYRFINYFRLHPLSFGPFNFPRLVSLTLNANSRLLMDVKMFLSIFNIEFGKLVFWTTSNDFFSPSCLLLSVLRVEDIVFQ
jgi:hypothetical protein